MRGGGRAWGRAYVHVCVMTCYNIIPVVWLVLVNFTEIMQFTCGEEMDGSLTVVNISTSNAETTYDVILSEGYIYDWITN